MLIIIIKTIKTWTFKEKVSNFAMHGKSAALRGNLGCTFKLIPVRLD